MLPGFFKNLSGFQKTVITIIILFFIFNISLFLIGLFTDEGDLRQMVKMAKYMSYLKYTAIINTILFTSIILMYSLQARRIKRISKKHEEENIRLRSTLYDIEKERSDILKG
jgi:hypothetical protein